jgi:phospholipid/cholesterol/gamma-HCH transport system permease protein
MAHIGVDSLPLVIVTVGFSGMVLSLYTSVEFIRLGAQKYVGGLVGLSVAREIAPVISAIVVSARVGSAIAAELGTMVVTQQVDALRALATSPTEYLVVPRFVACVVMLPVLGVFANLAGIGGGYLVAVHAGVHPAVYLDSLRLFVENQDLVVGLVKTVPFAIIISLVSCHQGLYTKGGAAGVGRATTSSVVMCIMLVYVADFFLSFLLPR